MCERRFVKGCVKFDFKMDVCESRELEKRMNRDIGDEFEL